MITKRDKVTGESECVPCLKCPEGQGLSVNCGDVITPQTPIVCQPCVLGKTYSASNDPGACKDCENCGEYRETIKACTLTSKAVCGKCKVGAYPEGLLVGMCKPCSPCCNDGNDIVIPECQVPGVATGMQCTYLRSEKCRKVVAAKVVPKPSLSTSSTVPNRSSVPPSTLYLTATKVTEQGYRSNEEQGIQYRGKQVKSDSSKDTTPSRSENTGLIVGPIFAIVVVVGLVLVCKFKPSIKQAFGKRFRAVPGEAGMIGIPLGQLQREDTGSETDVSQTPVTLGNPLEQRQGSAGTEELQETVVMLDNDTSSSVQESGDSPEPFPVPETQQQSYLDGSDKVSPVQDSQPLGGFEGKGKNQD